MKKEYVKPMMECEAFVANEYVAACYDIICLGFDKNDLILSTGHSDANFAPSRNNPASTHPHHTDPIATEVKESDLSKYTTTTTSIRYSYTASGSILGFPYTYTASDVQAVPTLSNHYNYDVIPTKSKKHPNASV